MINISNILLLSFLTIISIKADGQLRSELSKIRGIWIEETYFEEFNKNRSAIGSKNTFSHLIHPVGLRINEFEITKDSFNIGYSFLHDHLLHTENSGCDDYDNEHCEQGYFRISINEKYIDSQKSVEVWIKLASHGKRQKAIFQWNPAQESVQLSFDTFSISYKRFTNRFTTTYLYPNPIYFFTRYKVAFGTYLLQDSLGNTLDEKLQITRNGKVLSEYALFNNSRFHYSTDVYCGPKPPGDYCLFQKVIGENIFFVIERDKFGDIRLYKSISYSKDGMDMIKKSDIKYKMTKKY